MPEPEKKEEPAKTPKPRRKWLRRTLWGLLILTVVVAVFHRPLFHTGVRLLLIKVAARQNLTLDVHFSGTIWTNLTVRDVQALPNGKGSTPVEKITIEHVRLDYNLWRLIRRGVGEFLQSYEIRNADLRFVATPSETEDEKKQKRTLAQDLNNILAQPAAYADRVNIENFNIAVRAEKSETRVTGIHIALYPDKAGHFRIAELQAPGVPRLGNLSAETTYKNRNLFITGLELAPQVVFDVINFDASRRAQNEGSMAIQARLFGGTFALSLAGTQLKAKGENLERSYDTRLKIDITTLQAKEAAAFLELPPPPVRQLEHLRLDVTGEPEKPRTWTGSLSARLEGIAAGGTELQAVLLEMIFRDGTAQIQRALVEAGPNRVQFKGTALLPESVNDFPSTELDSQITLEAPDLVQLTAMLPEPIHGSAFGSGPVRIKGRQISTDLKLEVKDVRSPKFQVASGNVTLKATKDLDTLLSEDSPPDAEATANPQQRNVEAKTADKGVEPGATPLAAALEEEDKTKKESRPFWQGLDVQLRGEVKDFSSDAFSGDSASFDVTMQNDQVALREANVERNGNRIVASGNYRLPHDGRDIDAGAGDVRLKVDAPSLGDFRIRIAGATLSGHLTTDADLKMVGGALNGPISIDGRDFAFGDFRAESLTGKIQVSNDRAQIEQLVLRIDEQNTISIGGEAQVKKPITYDATLQARLNELAAFQPLLAVFGVKESIGGALHADWSGKGDVSAEVNAGKLQADARQVIYGERKLVEAQLGGSYDMREQQIAGDASLTARQLSGDIAVDSADVKLTATKKLQPKGGNIFENLESKVTASIDNGRFKEIAVDEVRLDGETGDRLVTLRELRITRAENRITAQGTYHVPQELDTAATAPIDAQFNISIPKLSDFGIAVGGQTLAGRVAGNGRVQVENNAYTGSIELDGGDFKIGGFRARRLASRINVANNTADVQQLALQINGTDQLAVVGQVGLLKPHAYEAALLVDIKSLASIQPLLEVFNVKEEVRGALKIDWNGKGDVATVTHSGELSVALRKGRYGTLDLSEVTLAGIYGPGFAESTACRFVTGATRLEAGLEYREYRFRLRDLNLQQGGSPVLTGFVMIPFDPNNRERPIAWEKRIAANLNVTKLDIARMMSSFGKETPVTGTVTANLLAGGTFLAPTAHLKMEARSLKANAAAKFSAADLDLTLHYSRKELSLKSELRQPQIQPLTITGTAPFDLEATVERRKLDPQLPVDISVRMPPSSLAFIASLTPAVRRIEGTAAIDMRVRGTVDKPAFSGAARIDIRSARLANDNVPAIGRFQADLGFANDSLRFNRFEGEIGGGSFKLGGSVGLATLTEPVFDLRLESDEVLVKRDDTITVRVDADVRLTGPLKAAAMRGDLFVVHSRFFKEIDIMPIALPGRPKPVPKEVRQESTVSFPTPPLRDMTFDVRIRTRPDDPFLIRGNLANGAARLDLRFAGTGLNPYLEGNVQVQEFRASLPFSRLNITRGFVTFNRDTPFQPVLDLQAESNMRDYLIRAYIFGSASDPQVQLSSEPPLPHADIVSLLATGITTSELAGNPNALASRAALLALQELYRKVFKKGASPEPADDEDSLIDRFEFDAGGTDNRTGSQELSGRFKINDKIYLIGEVDVAGEATGRLKYLIRFR
jgi:autotransporter translocation and assembly factor TamB